MNNLKDVFRGIGVQFRLLQDTIYVVANVKEVLRRAGLIAGEELSQ
jgi:hypothetical protein